MENTKSKVYIKIDEDNNIICCDGGYTMENIRDTEEWIFVDEGMGVKYNHCQNNYFEGGLYTEDGIPRWKWYENAAVLRSEEELETHRTALHKPVPSIEERLKEVETHLIATDEVAVDLYEQMLIQEEINVAQDEALCELYETMGV